MTTIVSMLPVGRRKLSVPFTTPVPVHRWRVFVCLAVFVSVRLRLLWTNEPMVMHRMMLDLGLSKVVKKIAEGTTEYYRMTGEVGSLRYMAPEVARQCPWVIVALVGAGSAVCVYMKHSLVYPLLLRSAALGGWSLSVYFWEVFFSVMLGLILL